MKTFAHFNARSLDEAVDILRQYGGAARIIAGGTDLLGKMKDEILPRYPEAVINIKSVPGLDFIREENGALKIGALTRLEDIAMNPLAQQTWGALAEAAHKAASPHLREMGTIGGNICQDIRCWYYRHPNNRFPCLRKGGGRCYAIEGDNRYHSIFGGTVEKGCYAVHPSDTAPALIALGARIATTKRTMPVEDLFATKVTRTTILDPDEIVTELEIPRPPENSASRFMKFALRKTIDFPIVNCAVRVDFKGNSVNTARICLNAVSPKPYRAKMAEEAVAGKELTEDIAEKAGEAAVSGAKPMGDNAYMVQIARVLVKRTLLACA